MEPPEPFYLYGPAATPRVITARQVNKKSDGLDGGSITYATTDDAPHLTEREALTDLHPGLVVDAISSVDVGAGVWEHTYSAIGLTVGARRARGYPQINDDAEGWDTITDKWFTSNRNYFTRGQAGSFGGTMICMRVQRQQILSNVWEVTGTFTGILSNKPPSRSVTCNGQTFSGDFYVNLESGWSNIRKSQIDLPKILVTDTYYTTSRPNTAAVPGTQTPPNAPNIRVLSFSGQVIAHWPNGWSLTVAYRQLPGVSLYEVDYIYEYKLKFTPGGE